MVVAVAVVLVMQMPADEIVDVVAVRDRLVATVRPVDVVGGVAGARVARAARVRVPLVDAEDVVVDVVAVGMAQTPVLDEIDVPLMDDGHVPAAGAVDVLGAVAGGRHRRIKVPPVPVVVSSVHGRRSVVRDLRFGGVPVSCWWHEAGRRRGSGAGDRRRTPGSRGRGY